MFGRAVPVPQRGEKLKRSPKLQESFPQMERNEDCGLLHIGSPWQV